jgi:hypothetical protein
MNTFRTHVSIWPKLLFGAFMLLAGCAATPQQMRNSQWTEFVQMPAHANPIPKQWIATPEGRFAHDLEIPNPVPIDSGFKEGMSSVDYYMLLCANEAGEFKFKTTANVEAIYFARPPKRPSDDDLKSRWVLEHPLIESKFQLVEAIPAKRAITFVNPPFMNFKIYEEPNQGASAAQRYLRMSGYQQVMRDKAGNLVSKGTPMTVEPVDELTSRYGVTWRGIRRPSDRENGIAGGEVIVYDIKTNEVLYVYRNYAFSGRTKGTPDGIWWLNSGGCQRVSGRDDPTGLYSISGRARTVLMD